MKLKIYHSFLNSISADKLISDLKNRDRTHNHIIITPDKASLNYERKLFDLNDESSFFDVTTTTLSRFSSVVASGNEKILTKQGGILIVKKLLIDNKNELLSFNKSSNLLGFAGALFDTICMFKSCNIEPNQIEDTTSVALTNKLKDIKLIYQKYEDYLKNIYIDSFNRLNVCIKNIDKTKFQNTDFYFVGFTGFTKQGYNLISKLMKCSSSVSVATTFASKGSKANSSIYLNDVYLNLVDIAKINGVILEKVSVLGDISKEQRFLSENVFASKINQYNDEQKYVKLFSYDTIDDEIKHTCFEIKKKIISERCRYKDFAIVLPNISKYKTKLINTLQELSMEYFLDEATTLKDTIIARFISNIISILYRPNKFNVFNFLKSTLINTKSNVYEYYQHVVKYDLSGERLLKADGFDVSEVLAPLYNVYCVKSKSTIEDLLNNIRKILDDIKFEEKVEDLSKKYFENGDLPNYRNLTQSYDKVLKIFDEINVINGFECGYLDLLKFFELFTENSSIAIPPILADAITITNYDCEILDNIDYIYFLGVSEGEVPKYITDRGLISDDDIDKMSISNKLNPTINVLNKRAKFKVFEMLFMAKKQCTISYHFRSQDGEMYPSSLVSCLQQIYGIDEIVNNSNNLNIIDNNDTYIDKNSVVFNNLSVDVAENNFNSILKFWGNYGDNINYVTLLSTLNNCIDSDEYLRHVTYLNEVKINRDIFLKKNRIDISEIEKFNSCPYKHFAEYGLKLKDGDISDITAKDIGNIIHEFLKIAIFNLNGNSKEILDKVLKQDKYKYLLENKKNIFTIRALYNEVERIYAVLKEQRDQSNFKTKYAEFRFNTKLCTIGGKDICLTGIVDRVDENSDGIRIIDYKTGKVSFKNYDDIFYGNKLQVVVYLSILSKENGVLPLGALYMPISNAFADEKSSSLYQMEGIVEDSLQNILNFDKNLSQPNYQSKIINFKTNNSGGLIKRGKATTSMLISKEEMSKLCDYVIDVVKTTVKNIKDNHIEPMPLTEDECIYCPYLGLCNYSKIYGNKERKDLKFPNVQNLFEGGEV